MEERWYKLDNAAKIYPAIREDDWASVFRADAVLKDDIDKNALQTALLMTYKRFPTFSVHISKGFFWYYFEPNESEPQVSLESEYPARPFSEKKDRGYLFRILYYKRRISLEVFHSISDGYGAAAFLKSLIFNYFTVIYGHELVTDHLKLEKYGIKYYKDNPRPEEIEDSFQIYASGTDELDLKEKIAFKIPGTRIRKNTVKVLHILMSVKKLNELAKSFNSTITEFLVSAFIYSILNARIYKETDTKPVKISVPVNLRKYFESKTMRNFSSYVNVEIYPKKEAWNTEFKDILKLVSKQIREGTDKNILRCKFSGNVKAEKNIALRVAPLVFKNLTLKTVFSLYGERLTTSTLSNVGRMTLPEEMSDLVERFDFLIGAPKENAYNCAVVSYNDILSISFTSIIIQNIVLEKFVHFFVENGIEVKVESNY